MQPERPVNRALIQLAVLRDAAHFADTTPVDDINVEQLTTACSLIFIACGLDEVSASTLVTESIDRHATRFISAMGEALNG